MHDYVLHDGDTARAVGLVVADPGKPTLFCFPAYASFDASFTGCPASSISAIGVDTDELAARETRDGTVDGYAELTGVYRDGTLTVTGQRAVQPTYSGLPDQTPPCPTPPGGWTGPE